MLTNVNKWIMVKIVDYNYFNIRSMHMPTRESYDLKRLSFKAQVFTMNINNKQMNTRKGWVGYDPNARPEGISFGYWENFQRLEAYFLRQYCQGKLRKPSPPLRIASYRAAGIQYCSFSYSGQRRISIKRLHSYAMTAFNSRHYELKALARKYLRAQEKGTLRLAVRSIEQKIRDKEDFVQTFLDRVAHGFQPTPSPPEEIEDYVEELCQTLLIHDPIIYHFAFFFFLSTLYQHFNALNRDQIASQSKALFKIPGELLQHPMKDVLDSGKLLPYFTGHTRDYSRTEYEQLDHETIPWAVKKSYDILTEKKRLQVGKSRGSLGPQEGVLFYGVRRMENLAIRILREERRQPLIFNKKFTLVDVADVSLMEYMYDRFFDNMVKANCMFSHLAWDSEVAGPASRIYERVIALGIQKELHLSKACIRVICDELKTGLKNVSPGFWSFTPVQKALYKAAILFGVHQLDTKYAYSDTPSASTVASIRELGLQENLDLVLFRKPATY